MALCLVKAQGQLYSLPLLLVYRTGKENDRIPCTIHLDKKNLFSVLVYVFWHTEVVQAEIQEKFRDCVLSYTVA
jgi:hypothetical protein